MKELNLHELTPRQKLGMVTAFLVNGSDENIDYIYDKIRDHACGAVWLNPTFKKCKEVMAKVKEIADYPVLIMCDAESGIGDHLIGRHNSLACTGSEELAYIFGKVTAVTARQMGYNVVCDPVVDMCIGNHCCGATVRSMGNDKHKVAALAVAEARGMHDGGILSVAKHYPGKCKLGASGDIDSHMAETLSSETLEELIDYNLYPYRRMMEEGLLDGIMTRHGRYENIDPDYPASLSKKMIGIIRDLGFDGFAITDALAMMGIVAKYGRVDGNGLCIANGNDLALPWVENKFAYDAMCDCYDRGLIPDERLDEAVRRILDAQHKTLSEPKFTELTDEDLELFERINKDSVYARTDDGVEVGLSRDGKHLFVVLVESTTQINDKGKVSVDTMLTNWYDPNMIIDRLTELFPNSRAHAHSEFPTAAQNSRLLSEAVDYDDVVFITFMQSMAYIGHECLTSRIISVMEAMQVTNKVSTVIHFGNPYVMEDVPHIPRILIGTLSKENVKHTLNVLAGEYPAKGVLTYDVKFK